MKIILMRVFRILLLLGIVGVGIYWFYPNHANTVVDAVIWKAQKQMTKKSVNDVLASLGADAKERLLPWFEKAKVPYPPQRLALLGFKAEKRLEMWAEQDAIWTPIRSYPILAASGVAGPGPIWSPAQEAALTSSSSRRATTEKIRKIQALLREYGRELVAKGLLEP